MTKRHFPYQHPTFGTKNNPRSASYQKRSVYYWWYEYLKRHEGYKRTCKHDGKGRFAKLYEDFGNVHDKDFKTWWTTDGRGVRLFAEPKSDHHFELVAGQILEEDLLNDQLLILKVPLNFPKRFLLREFNEMLNKYHQGKQGHSYARKSEAKYPVDGQPNVKFLETALAIWDMKQENPKMQLWKIGNELKIIPKQVIGTRDTDAEKTNKKNILAATVSRILKKVDALIENVGRGRFPDTKSAK